MNDRVPNVVKKIHHRLREQIAGFKENRQHEEALINEINRILSETKTKIPLLPHYQKKLKEPVHTAWGIIDNMMSHIPGPITIDPANWGKSPVLNAIFSGPDEFSNWLSHCHALQDAFQQTDANELFGLLVTEYHEKKSLGVAMVGDVVQKDVLQKSVYFEDPKILVPQPDLETAKIEIRHRILVILFTRELEEIADLKALTEELEKQQETLEILLQNRKKHSKEEDDTDKGAKQIISDIDRKIDSIGGHPDSPEGHLQHVIEVLMNIEKHINMTPIVLRLNNLGIEVDKSSSEPFDEISFAECTFTGEHRRTVIWTRIDRKSLKPA